MIYKENFINKMNYFDLSAQYTTDEEKTRCSQIRENILKVVEKTISDYDVQDIYHAIFGEPCYDLYEKTPKGDYSRQIYMLELYLEDERCEGLLEGILMQKLLKFLLHVFSVQVDEEVKEMRERFENLKNSSLKRLGICVDTPE